MNGLLPVLRRRLKAFDRTLEIHDGWKLAYSREARRYLDDGDAEQEGNEYETDLIVIERSDGRWTPRVVVEAKLVSFTTHDAITYSQKAATHKQVHPYLRYGIFLGGRAHHPLPGRLFRHGVHFDFMLSWRAREPAPAELTTFVRTLREEVEASRTFEGILYDTRSRNRRPYTLLRRGLSVE